MENGDLSLNSSLRLRPEQRPSEELIWHAPYSPHAGPAPKQWNFVSTRARGASVSSGDPQGSASRLRAASVPSAGMTQWIPKKQTELRNCSKCSTDFDLSPDGQCSPTGTLMHHHCNLASILTLAIFQRRQFYLQSLCGEIKTSPRNTQTERNED